ncbi:MAG: hypothetical protein FJW56_08935 [Actinobacteria bacterium]|nr:hypothetical protein [Actinomycetota bacterium]
MYKVIEWLLEDDNPAVKFYTRKYILPEIIYEDSCSDIEKQIISGEPVKSILNLQHPGGWWFEDSYFLNPLYKNTFWQLYFLSLLGTTRNIKSIDKAVRLIVNNMQSEKGSFLSTKKYKGNLICMQGIALEMLIRLGYLEEDFAKKLIFFINDIVYRDDFRCKYRQQLKCPWGAVKILKAFNLIPDKSRDDNVINTINKSTKFLLGHNIVEAKYPRKKLRSSQWFIFGFPRGFQSDILEIASSLVEAGCSPSNTNLKNALKYISNKRLTDGSWKMEFSLNGRMLVDIEKKNKPSKWITFIALKTLIKSGYIKF